MKGFKIGNLKIENPLVLAPMLDVTNLPYRVLCRDAGAGLCFTEMLYVDQILHENAKTLEMMKTSKSDSPIGIQLTGNDVEEFKKVVKFLGKYDLIDLNCGCPSIRIIGTKAGAHLMTDPKKIAEIIRVLKTSGKPVSVKIRLGFMKNNALEVAKIAEKAGADAITVHARLSNQSYSKPADWKEIAKIKKAVKIPVIGNGDVFSGEDAKKMLEICDGVMIGRGAIGDPLVFKRILNYLKTGKEIAKKTADSFSQFQKYIKLCEKHKILDLQKIKYVGSNFLKNFSGASKKRNDFVRLKTFEEMEKFVEKLK